MAIVVVRITMRALGVAAAVVATTHPHTYEVMSDGDDTHMSMTMTARSKERVDRQR